MKVVIGLGNPGKQYEGTRHNVGHMFIDSVSLGGSEEGNLKLLKSDSFMNNSGDFVQKEVSTYRGNWEKDGSKVANLFIVHDDLDIPLGQFKIQKAVGPKVHYGVNSIEERVGSKEFWRVRIGVDARLPEKRIPGEAYVLQRFSPEERQILDTVFPKIWEELKAKLT